ncbi:hypothetical protein XI09_28125 [Bradyrhizobium sp. CCBAU 11386]|nr:hypothetical protein [Bradyrhizobium sp. CCBAU 11386]
MSWRVAGLLDDRNAAMEYETLFNIRSAFVHGRTMGAISTEQRILARSLARRVVWQLVLMASNRTVTSRASFLENLLDRGLLLR